MTIEFSNASARLRELIQEFSPLGELSNEAETRFQFIDHFLTDCLGWRKSEIKVEKHESGKRTDYECGEPRQIIVEAKQAAESFELPPRSKRSGHRIKIKSLMDFNSSTKNAIEQVLSYCQGRGVPIAVIANGPQLVFFLASRLDGVSPLDGDSLAFDSYEAILEGFPAIFENLSPEGVSERRLQKTLENSTSTMLPQKLSSSCLNYYSYKYSSDFQESLRNSAALVIEDISRTADYEKEFLRECYCESGPLTQYSLLSKNIISARYAALFSTSDSGSLVEPINPKSGKARLSDKTIADALARRPIVLVGDVGVGKTSFIKNLIQVDAKKDFDRATFLYFDLGSKGALSTSTREALLRSIEQDLRKH